jgi:hypothetical protein
MHRTEGSNNLANLFTDGPPGTTLDAAWCNAVQEEIVNVIENAGLSLLTAGTDTRDQLKRAIYNTSQHWHTDGVEDISLWLTNGATGEATTDGVRMTCRSDGDAEFNQYENGNMIFKTNNSEAIRITNVNAAATPSLIFQGDVDTGIWHPAANALAWSTAGVERLRLLADGKIITNAGGTPLCTTGGLHVYTADSGASVSADADELIIEGSGSSGITIASGNTNQGGILFADVGSASDGWVAYNHGAAPYLYFGVGIIERMRIDNSGDVTITGGVSRNGQSVMNTKELDIGDWNMDTTANLNVAHGLGGDWQKIRNICIVIRNDANTTHYDLMDSGVQYWDSTNITMERNAAGTFDNANFDSTSYNRGFIYIEYIN